MKTTSHGLAQGRLAGCLFDIAVITNITHEHLDYHGSYAAYREAKARLFRALGAAPEKRGPGGRLLPKTAILNRDDGSYDFLAGIPAARQIAYGIEGEANLTVAPAPQGTGPSPYSELPSSSETGSPFGDTESDSPPAGTSSLAARRCAGRLAYPLRMTDPATEDVPCTSISYVTAGHIELSAEGTTLAIRTCGPLCFVEVASIVRSPPPRCCH